MLDMKIILLKIWEKELPEEEKNIFLSSTLASAFILKNEHMEKEVVSQTFSESNND